MRCRASSLGLSHLPSSSSLLPPPLDEERQAGSHLRRNKPPKERERTNKSARAVRRDIVSCKVNHLRGSKTASSPRKNPFAASPPPLFSPLPGYILEASRRRLLPLPMCCTSWLYREPIAISSPFYLLLLLLLSYLLLAFLLRGQSS